jgi:hypothetical protein
MVFRATAILCCLLTTSVPTLTLVQVIDHAHEHLDTILTGHHGHTHEDGEIPHHQHDQDGSPIPMEEWAGVGRILPPMFAKILLQPIQPAPFAPTLAAALAWHQATFGPVGLKWHIPAPRAPSPGDTLPLLI